MKFDLKKKYLRAKKNFLNDPEICKENRTFFKKFLDEHENKLKRINGLNKLDNGTYQTLLTYIARFKNVNRWFNNKPLKDITKKDIKRVYDNLEDGKYLNALGKPFEAKSDYYNKIFKSKPFQMIGKDIIAREVIQYSQRNKVNVRFILEEDVRKIIDCVYKPINRLLCWLAFDMGENINSLLKLRKSDFYRETNEDTKEPEYRINLRPEILKRSRTPRSEVTNFNETVILLDQLLPEILEDEPVFPFDYQNAKKILSRAVERSAVKCRPDNQQVTWKDFRSGMACDLLKKGWTREEVNARLGHKPSSVEIDKYINFLALDRRKPKRKVYTFKLEQLQDRISKYEEQIKILQKRDEKRDKEFQDLRIYIKNLIREEMIG